MKTLFVSFLILAVSVFSVFSEELDLFQEYEKIRALAEREIRSIRTREAYEEVLFEYKVNLRNLISGIDFSELARDNFLTYLNILLEVGDYDDMENKIEHGIDKFSELIDEISMIRIIWFSETGNHKGAVSNINLLRERDSGFIQTKGNELFNVLRNMIDSGEYTYAMEIKDIFLTLRLKENYPFFIADTLSHLFMATDRVEDGIKFLGRLFDLYDDDRVQKAIRNVIGQLSIIGKEPFPLEALVSLNGYDSLEAHRGKVILLDFWAPWCGPCRNVIPHLVDLYGRYKEQGLVIIGITQFYGSYNDGNVQKRNISPEEETELIKGFITEYGMLFSNIIVSPEQGHEKYNVSGIPHMVIIGRDHQIKSHKIGYAPKEDIERILLEYL